MNIRFRHISQSLLKILIIAAVSIVLFAGCGGSAKEENTTSLGSKPGPGAVADNEATPSTGPAENGLVKLVINSDDQMRYDKDELRVKAGSTVELTLNHTGQLAKEAMGHNVVILKPGTDIASFAQKAFTARNNDYIPEGDAIIAHTKLIGGGESTIITFEAPAKGTYDFICSFPGHYGLMQGKFIVE